MPKITEYAKVASMIGVSSLAVIYYLQNVINDMHWKYHSSNDEYEKKMSDALGKLKMEIWEDYYKEDKELEERVYKFYHDSDPKNAKRVIEQIDEIFKSNKYPDHVKIEVSNKLRLPKVSRVHLWDKSIYDTFHINKQYYINVFNNLCFYFPTFKVNNEDNIISEMFSDFIIKNTYRGTILASKPQNILEEFKNQFAGSYLYDTILLMEKFSEERKDISDEKMDPNVLAKSMIEKFNNDEYYSIGYRNAKNIISLITNMNQIKTPEILIRFCDKKETYKYTDKKYNYLEINTIKFCYIFLNFYSENIGKIYSEDVEAGVLSQPENLSVKELSFRNKLGTIKSIKCPDFIKKLLTEDFKKYFKIIYEKETDEKLKNEYDLKDQNVKDELLKTKKIISLWIKYYSEKNNLNEFTGSGFIVSYFFILILVLIVVILLIFVIKNYIYLPVK